MGTRTRAKIRQATAAARPASTPSLVQTNLAFEPRGRNWENGRWVGDSSQMTGIRKKGNLILALIIITYS